MGNNINILRLSLSQDEVIKVDCIIPCYNNAGTVVAAIQSVLTQDIDGLWIIVVNDGSTDDSAARVAAFNHPRITLISQTNQGPSAARNTGIRSSRARYCAFLDADDLWLPGKLAHQINVLDSIDDERVIGHCVSFRQVWPTGIATDRILPSSLAMQDSLFDACMTTIGSTGLVRRSAFETIGLFDEGLRCFEDWDWHLRCLLLGQRFETSPQVFVEKQEGRRRSGRLVEDGVAHMRRYVEAVRASFGPRAARCFKAALAFELAVARLVQRHWAGFSCAIIASIVGNPSRALSSLLRICHRLVVKRRVGTGAVCM